MRDPAEPIRTLFIIGLYIGVATISTFLALWYAAVFIDGNAFLIAPSAGLMTVVGAILLFSARLTIFG